MFGLAAGFYRSYLAPAKLSVLFVGTDGAGKTTLLERVKVTQFRTYRGGSIPDPPEVRTGKLRRWHSEGEAKPEKREGTKHATKDIRTAPASPGGDIIWLDDGGGGGGGGGVVVPSHPPAKNSAPPTHPLKHSSSDPVVAVAPSTVPRKRSFMRCPAPRAYSRESMASADKDEYEEVVLTPQTSRVNDDAAAIVEDPATAGSRDSTTTEPPNNDIKPHTHPTVPQSGGEGNGEDSKGITRHRIHVEHDLKKGAKMLPLHAIRPTLGQNLGKIEACGCKLEILDLGGSVKMRPLWDRYLSDVDAVVFVVDASPLSSRSKLEEAISAFKGVLTKLRQGDKEEDDTPEPLEAGVPVLVFANKSDIEFEEALDQRKRESKEEDGEPVEGGDSRENEPLQIELDELSSLFCDQADLNDERNRAMTESNPIDNETENEAVVVCRGSAKTGEGVRTAFEWLIPTAKMAQRERQKLS